MTNINEDEFAVTSWGESAPEPFGITLPSGQRCLVRKLEMEDVLAHGLLNDLDSFSTSLLEDEESKDESAEDVMKSFQDSEKFTKLTATVNKIVMITVLRPSVYPKPESSMHPVTRETIAGIRIPGRAYVDQISFMDKMAIFQAVFEGMKGLDRFREGQEAGLGTVEDVEAVPAASELLVGDNSPL